MARQWREKNVFSVHVKSRRKKTSLALKEEIIALDKAYFLNMFYNCISRNVFRKKVTGYSISHNS